MYDEPTVRTKLDGWGDRVCYYRQTKGICTGVTMEWVRRLILGDKEGEIEPSMYPKMIRQSADYRTQNKEAFAAQFEKKERKREHAQNTIYDKARNAFASDVEHNPARHKCLADWLDLNNKWNEPTTKGDSNPRYILKQKIIDWAKRHGQKDPPGGVEKKSVADYLEKVYDSAYENDYWEWRKTEPIEVGIFKEYSESVEREFFDEKSSMLRARFQGLKVVESANSLQIPGKTAATAVAQAVRHSAFTPDRALVFGILGKGIAHSLGLYRVDDENILWMDPNYGVWSMTENQIGITMAYLFDATGEPGEAGVYQVNGHGHPTGFEFSVWDYRG